MRYLQVDEILAIARMVNESEHNATLTPHVVSVSNTASPAHLKDHRDPARHLGRREHMSDTFQAAAGLLSRQQTADPTSARRR